MSFALVNGECYCAFSFSSLNHSIYFRNSQLVALVANDNFSAIDEFPRNRVTVADGNGNSPLHIAILLNKKHFFHHLLDTESININAKNSLGLTPLHLAVKLRYEYYVMELIKRRAEVNTKDLGGCTPLHLASYYAMPNIWQILLQNGADVNAVNNKLKTPLYHACEKSIGINIYMLLYYGADPNIATIYNILPLTAAIESNPYAEYNEVLYNSTIVDEPYLSLLTSILKKRSPLYTKIMNEAQKIEFTSEDLTEFCGILVNLKTDIILEVNERFPYIFEALLREESLLCNFIVADFTDLQNMGRLMDLFTIFFNNNPSFNCFQNFSSGSIIISHLFFLDSHYYIEKDALMSILYFFYSYGFPCEPDHILNLYKQHGYCDLLKMLLETGYMGSITKTSPVMGLFILYPDFVIDDYLLTNPVPTKGDEALLRFFANQDVRKYFEGRASFEQFLKRSPKIPSLVELARDATRLHVYNGFQITEAHKYYQLINRLPICEIHKKILRYEVPLYDITE